MSKTRIAIIDADLIGRKKHRFPNLACMKLSGFYKSQNCDVELLQSYDTIDEYDKVFISRVFTDTDVPQEVLEKDNVEYGGTGFFFDQAPNLPDEIEHSFPDYHLYDAFVQELIKSGVKPSELKEYTDYSIGFITRGCFRKCGFCVNKKYDRVFAHSPLAEFYDPDRPKICLLDDNFFGYPHWEDALSELAATGKPFKFKQGLDERLLTDRKCELLCSAKYDGAITFAFDNIADYKAIDKKLQLLRQYTPKEFVFYVLVAYDREEKWGADFWRQDINDLFVRCELLARYRCLPYIMRFAQYENSPYRGLYITIARWANQRNIYKKKSLREFVELDAAGGAKASTRYLEEFEKDHPDVASAWFDWKWACKEAGDHE